MEVARYAAGSLFNLHATTKDSTGEPVWATGTMPRVQDPIDLLEISSTARQLSAEAIEHRPAHFFGAVEIDDSLQRILKGKPPEVGQAVYTLIQDNLLPDGSVSDEGQRAALLEAGLSQAQYLADRAMTDGEADEFMSVIRGIAAIAKTRTADPVTGEITYKTPPQKPRGAPDDYVSMSELMKRFEPKTYEAYREAAANGTGGLSVLLQFAKRVPLHPDWLNDYREEKARAAGELRDTKLDNRFAGADTSGKDAFIRDMNSKIEMTSFEDKSFLLQNMASFARLLR